MSSTQDSPATAIVNKNLVRVKLFTCRALSHHKNLTEKMELLLGHFNLFTRYQKAYDKACAETTEYLGICEELYHEKPLAIPK